MTRDHNHTSRRTTRSSRAAGGGGGGDPDQDQHQATPSTSTASGGQNDSAQGSSSSAFQGWCFPDRRQSQGESQLSRLQRRRRRRFLSFFLSFFGLDADQSSDITCHSTSLSLSSLNEQKNWPSHKLFRISSIKELDLLLRTESTLESQTETEMESQTTTS